MARQQVMEQNKQEIEEQAAQFGGQVPQELQQQFQMEIENQVAEQIVKMTEELVGGEQDYLEGENSDPLIDLKQQELNIRSQEIQQNKQNADTKT